MPVADGESTEPIPGTVITAVRKAAPAGAAVKGEAPWPREKESTPTDAAYDPGETMIVVPSPAGPAIRSEERRVGKECRL